MVNYQGYFYHYEKDGVGKKFWECEFRKPKGCKARLWTSENLNNLTLIEKKGVHVHEPNPIRVEIKKCIQTIKETATQSTSTPAQIIAQSLGGVSAVSQAALPVAQNLKRYVRSVRQVNSGSLAVPHSREDIDFPFASPFRFTLNQDQFLFSDSGPNKDRILIFTTDRNIEFLKHSEVIFYDGTFSSAPVFFEQLFIWHGYRQGVTFPLIYCLLPRRDAVTYRRMIKTIKDAAPNLNPKCLMGDFELASLNAFSDEFPQAEKKACFFHYAQCLFRNIQQHEKVYERYSTIPEFAFELRKLVALAFIPPQDVIATFDQLMDQDFFQENEEILLDFIQYFERVWIGKLNRRRTARLAPTYPIGLWNCFQSILDNLPKTNNTCEGFNHALSNLIGASHPTIYKLIDGLKSEQALTELKMNQFMAGNIAPSNKKYSQAAQKLKSVVEEYAAANYSPMEHLQKLTHCILK
jgi:MULE transposase-like protein/FLYWCH-type zinc finger protein